MQSNPSQAKVDHLNARREQMNARLVQIKSWKPRAAWVNGHGAGGELDQRRTSSLTDMGGTHDALEAAGGRPASSSR